jgi:hypothetical protein
MKKNLVFRYILLACVFVSGISFSCKKDDPTIASINVVRLEGTNEVPVGGATVRLYADITDTSQKEVVVRFDESGQTDAVGNVQFDYSDFIKPGTAGFVVLDIEVDWKGMYRKAVMDIEEKTTTEYKVILQ